MLRAVLLVALLAGCTKSSETKGEAPSNTAPVAASKVEPVADETPADDTSFQLTLEEPAAVAPGGEAVARIKVTPGTGYKMNAEFPTKLTLEPPAGVKLAKTTFALSDAEAFDDHQLVFAVKATPENAGEFTVTGKIKFAVCTDATCDPKKRNVSIKVAAK